MASEDFIEKLNCFFFDNITRKYKNIAKVFFFFGLGSFLLGLVFLLFGLLFSSYGAGALYIFFVGIGVCIVPSCWFLYGLADLLDNVHHIRLEMTRGFLSNERSKSIDQLPRL